MISPVRVDLIVAGSTCATQSVCAFTKALSISDFSVAIYPSISCSLVVKSDYTASLYVFTAVSTALRLVSIALLIVSLNIVIAVLSLSFVALLKREVN